VVLYPPKRTLFSLLIIASVVTAPLFLYQPVLSALGYSVKIDDNTITSRYLSYLVSTDRHWIYIWTQDTAVGEPRAYRIPYSESAEKKLEEAEGEKGDGIPQQVEIAPASAVNNDSAEGQLNFEPLPEGGSGK
jgi:hypothetical protein